MGLGRDLVELSLPPLSGQRVHWHAKDAAIVDVRPLPHGLAVRVWEAMGQQVTFVPYGKRPAMRLPTDPDRVVGMGLLSGDDISVAVQDSAGNVRFDTYRTAAGQPPRRVASYPCSGDCVPHNWAPGAAKPVFTTLKGTLRITLKDRVGEPPQQHDQPHAMPAHSLWLSRDQRSIVVGYSEALYVLDARGQRRWRWRAPPARDPAFGAPRW